MVRSIPLHIRSPFVNFAVVTREEPTTKVGWFRRLREGWKRVGKKIANFQARALLTVFYFAIVGPFALIVRWRSDPLALKAGSQRGWRLRSTMLSEPLDRARKQF